MKQIPTASGTVAEIVDVFKCCLFTWEALVTVLPAFLLAGAIAAFLPAHLVLRYLGRGANKLVAYSVASISGVLLSLCSCNVVPLFLSIYRTGAGIGPACAFLYAGPAINIVSMLLVFDIISWQYGFWRAVLVPVVAVACGLTMAAIFGREARPQEPAAKPLAGAALSSRKLMGLFGLLVGMVVYGAWKLPQDWELLGVGVMGLKLIGVGAFLCAIALVIALAFSWEHARTWAGEVWTLFKIVIPVLIPAVVLIGLASAWIDIKWIDRHVGDNSLRSILFADLFSEVMYFPILSEVVFTKAMLKLGMGTGPAMAVLLTGTGASLPGAIIIARGVGWKKAVVYMACEIVFSTLAAMFFASDIAKYICDCMMTK